MKQFDKYINITTDRIVEVEKIYNSGVMEQPCVAYIRTIDMKGFIKPLHVFEKTYKLYKKRKT